MFWCLLHHLQGDTCLAQKLCFLQCCQKIYNVPLFFFLIYSAVTVFKTIFISSFWISKALKMLVKILGSNALLSVGSCKVLCMLAIHVFTVSRCAWVCNGAEILKGPCCLCPLKISTPLQTQTQLDAVNTRY